MEAELLRVGIAGSGFIGRVHARSARAGGRPRWSPSRPRRPRARSAAAAELGAERALGSAEELVAPTRHRRGPHLHAQPPPPAARRGGARGGQARGLREAAGARRRRGRAARRGRGRVRAPGRRPLRLPLLPDGARGARARRAGASRADPLLHGTYLQDWLLAPRGRQLARRRATWAAPRGRSPTSARTGATSPSSSRATASRALSARTLTAVPERGPAPRTQGVRAAGTATGESPRGRGPRTRRSSSSRPTRGALGSVVSARCRPAARTGCGSSSTAPRRRSRSTRSSRRQLWAGRREAATIVRRDPESLSPAAGSLRHAARRPSAGLRRLLRRLRRGLLRDHPDGRCARRPAGVRRRAARRPHHGGRAGSAASGSGSRCAPPRRPSAR